MTEVYSETKIKDTFHFSLVYGIISVWFEKPKRRKKKQNEMLVL